MKTTLIGHLHPPQIKKATFELFEYIEVTYGIKSPDDRFPDHFINVLNKNYGHLNFEQIEDAFFRNSTGLLDNFLPKVGMRSDNKVLKFSIQDLTKIINAFCKYLGIEKNESGFETKVFSEQEKKEIHIKWLKQLIENFDTYRNDNVRLGFSVPLYTSIFLSELGLIDELKIIVSDKFNIKIGNKKYKKTSSNEKLIYECFDEIIADNKHLNEFIPNDDADKIPF